VTAEHPGWPGGGGSSGTDRPRLTEVKHGVERPKLLTSGAVDTLCPARPAGRPDIHRQSPRLFRQHDSPRRRLLAPSVVCPRSHFSAARSRKLRCCYTFPMRYLICKYIVTLKAGLGSLKVIENYTIRSDTHDFLLTFHSSHRPISFCF